MPGRRRSPRRSGNATSSIAPTASRTSSTSTSTWCTRSPPQAFDGLRLHGRHGPPPRPHRRDDGPQRADHRPGPSPTRSRSGRSRRCRANAEEFGITLLPMGAPGQGIVHVIGPEQGYTQPGLAIVCGDSHTSTHGAFGALAFGIGTSEVEHVLATQTLPQTKPSTMAVTVERRAAGRRDREGRDPRRSSRGSAPTAASATSIEYRGSAIRALSMEGRMTVCNMSIEAGARAGMIAPDDTTFAYVEGRPHAPQGADWERALDDWRSLPTDDGATFDTEVTIDADRAAARTSRWGTNPSADRHDRRRRAGPRRRSTMPASAEAAARALAYMALAPGTPIREIRPDTIFIGSCTNSRIEDLRVAAERGRWRARSPPGCARWSCPARSP